MTGRETSPGPRQRLELRRMLNAVSADEHEKESPDAVQHNMYQFMARGREIAKGSKQLHLEKDAVHGRLGGTVKMTALGKPVDPTQPYSFQKQVKPSFPTGFTYALINKHLKAWSSCRVSCMHAAAS